MIDTITFLREQGIDPFQATEDGRPAWEVLDERCRAIAESRGMVPVMTDRVEWHEGYEDMAQVVEWREEGVEQ